MERIKKAVLRTRSGLEFAYPTYEGSYNLCRAQIKGDGLQESSFGQLVRILYDATIQDPNNEYSREIRKLVNRHATFGSFTTFFYDQNRIVIEDRPSSFDSEDGDFHKLPQYREVVERMQQVNGAIRSLGYDFSSGRQTALKTSDNPLVAKITNSEAIAYNLAEILDEADVNLRLKVTKRRHMVYLRPCTIHRNFFGDYTIDCTHLVYNDKKVHTFGIVHDPLEGK